MGFAVPVHPLLSYFLCITIIEKSLCALVFGDG